MIQVRVPSASPTNNTATAVSHKLFLLLYLLPYVRYQLWVKGNKKLDVVTNRASFEYGG